MKKNYLEQQPCTYSEQLAAYLYDEIGGGEKASFESHLSGCESCAVELQDFGMLRSSIANWREIDFAPLPTPIIVLPAINYITAEKLSTFDKLRKFFIFSPARAVFASVLALLFFAGLFWVGSNSFRREELADLNEAEKIAVKEENLLSENETAPPVSSPADSTETSAKNANVLPKDSSTANKNSGGKHVIKDIATPIPLKQKTTIRSSASKSNNNPQIKSSRRNDVDVLDEDDEDHNTLRLSDVFSEIGMNDSNDEQESK